MKNNNRRFSKSTVSLFLSLIILCFTFSCSTLKKEAVEASTEKQGDYKLEVVVPGSDLKGVHGLGFDSADRLYTACIAGNAIYGVDTKTGEVSVEVGPVIGHSDDIEFGSDGSMVWTSFLQGTVRSKDPSGNIKDLAKGLPGVNSLAFKQDGRLFTTQVFMGDALHEIDPKGKKPPRKIMENMGGLNGFDFGPDGMLYGPLWFKGVVVKVDVDTAEMETVASGFSVPAAVNFDSKGNLWVVDGDRGEVVKVDIKTGDKTVVATLKPSLDNLAFDSKDNLYVTNSTDNGVYQVDTQTGAVRTVVEGILTVPSGLDVYTENGKDTIYLADTFAYRSINGATGQVTEIGREHDKSDEVHRPFSARVTEKYVLLSSWMLGAVQIRDRKTQKPLETFHGLKAPYDALALPDGGFLVAELGTGSLLKISGDHGKDRSVVINKLIGPLGLTWAGGNAVYLSEAFSGVISKIDLQTKKKTPIASGLKLPEGIDVTPDGKIIVAEVGLKRIVSIDPKDGSITAIAENLAIGVAPSPGLPPSYLPTGISVSDSGVIYFSSDVENAVYKLTPQ